MENKILANHHHNFRLTLQFSFSFCLARLALLLAATVSTDVMGDSAGSITNMTVVIDLLRDKGTLVSYEPIWHPQNSRTKATQISEMDEPASILQRACQEFTDYTWERHGNRYRVFPARDALSSTVLPSIALSNRSLLAILTDSGLDANLKRCGLFLAVQRHQINQWRIIPISLTFASGNFATLLDGLSDRLGRSVTWSIEFTRSEPMRIVLGNQVSKRPFFILHFDSLTGERLKTTQEMLKSADTDELRQMLTQHSGLQPTEVALELAFRYWQHTNVLETTNFLRRAEDLSQSEDQKWNIRYRALIAGLGYPTWCNASEPLLVQHEAFIKKCTYAPIRREALFWLLNEYGRSGQEKEARCLIEAESKDRLWQNQAIRQFQHFFPKTIPINIPHDQESASPASYIHTSVTIEKTPDGILRGKKTSEKVDIVKPRSPIPEGETKVK